MASHDTRKSFKRVSNFNSENRKLCIIPRLAKTCDKQNITVNDLKGKDLMTFTGNRYQSEKYQNETSRKDYLTDPGIESSGFCDFFMPKARENDYQLLREEFNVCKIRRI